mmetsp:Transcript_44933/g.128928  ORF Transcript_44933/g.128928 Transcript_44933/m.128928 type:complete len:257 (-) Transcript_44933:1061-1831(-)
MTSTPPGRLALVNSSSPMDQRFLPRSRSLRPAASADPSKTHRPELLLLAAPLPVTTVLVTPAKAPDHGEPAQVVTAEGAEVPCESATSKVPAGSATSAAPKPEGEPMDDEEAGEAGIPEATATDLGKAGFAESTSQWRCRSSRQALATGGGLTAAIGPPPPPPPPPPALLPPSPIDPCCPRPPDREAGLKGKPLLSSVLSCATLPEWPPAARLSSTLSGRTPMPPLLLVLGTGGPTRSSSCFTRLLYNTWSSGNSA